MGILCLPLWGLPAVTLSHQYTRASSAQPLPHLPLSAFSDSNYPGGWDRNYLCVFICIFDGHWSGASLEWFTSHLYIFFLEKQLLHTLLCTFSNWILFLYLGVVKLLHILISRPSSIRYSGRPFWSSGMGQGLFPGWGHIAGTIMFSLNCLDLVVVSTTEIGSSVGTWGSHSL